MKKLFKTLLSIVIFLVCMGHLSAQRSSSATVIPLYNDNKTQVMAQIDNMISYPLDMEQLDDFLTTAYQNRVYTYNPSVCGNSGLHVFHHPQNSAVISFEFNNFVPSGADVLFVGEYNFAAGKTTFAVHGAEVTNGINKPINEIMNHIFLVGNFCTTGQSSFSNQYSSSWEIIIIEKNIL